VRQRVSLREHFRRGNAAAIQIVALHSFAVTGPTRTNTANFSRARCLPIRTEIGAKAARHTTHEGSDVASAYWIVACSWFLVGVN
jgi:hypothetical protein